MNSEFSIESRLVDILPEGHRVYEYLLVDNDGTIYATFYDMFFAAQVLRMVKKEGMISCQVTR